MGRTEEDVPSKRFGAGVRLSLARQSLLVAVVCLAVDFASFLVQGSGTHGWTQVALLLLIVAVDAALALPASASGWVALAHGLARVVIGAVVPSPMGHLGSSAGGLIAGYRAGAWLRGWSAPAALAALAGGIVVSQRLAGGVDWFGSGLALTTDAVLPWLVGRYTTARRAYIDELRYRREVELLDAAAEVERAVAHERTAIARDLHDVISHHVSAIGVHAGAARMRLDAGGAGDVVAGSLAEVERSSRAAMADLRRMLDVLHGSEDTTTRQPGIGNLESLLDGVRRSGVDVRFSVCGAAYALPGSVDVALYRMSQEMLTNALRHGDGTAMDVELVYLPRATTVTVRNGVADGGRDTAGAGRGLAGVRTRAALFHGTVGYGPRSGTGAWETSVTVPVEEAS